MRVMNEKGFTLPEVLLVLTVSVILLGIPQVVSASYTQKMEERLFLEQLQSSIAMIQNDAILNERVTQMQTFRDNKLIRFTVVGDSSNSLNHTLELPESVSLIDSTMTYRFSSGSGNLGEMERLSIRIGKEKVELVFQMGSGRYKIEREG